jgi:cobalamin biosynthesis protein CobD/CbiB
MAGVLGVQLGGRNDYDGVSCERPVIGAGLRVVAVEDVAVAMRMMAVASVLGVLVAWGILWVI